MNKCRRNAARKRRGNEQHGPVKLNVRRYSSDRVALLMKLIRMELRDGGYEQVQT